MYTKCVEKVEIKVYNGEGKIKNRPGGMKMKVLILNGSPREGNTCVAANAMKKGMEQAGGFEVKEIKAADVAVSACIACGACSCDSKCVFDDDSNDVMDAIEVADAVIFATPVYWWGMTSQLKLIVDKMYSRYMKGSFTQKKVGVVVIGEADQDDPQYEIIPKQFECICGCVGWEMAFCKTYTAGEAGVLAENEIAVKELETIWKKLK